jgi:endonuclease/exonuclease/phosphatase family metal-dependent hydrolase
VNLITWNVQWFCGIDGQVSVERVVQEVRAIADVDVLCLQEVAVNYPQLDGGAGFDQVARLRELLPGWQVCFGAAVDELGSDGQRRRFGNLVASRLPVLQLQHHPLPYPADGGVRSMPRMCSSATLATPLGPIRVMTSHLEFYSTRQRQAQADALLALHRQACAHAAQPPQDDRSGQPFQNKPHTASAILCGDFNFEPHAAEYQALQAGSAGDATRLTDAWRALRGAEPHAPSFRVHDRRYGPQPIACDFVFVSVDLAPRLRRIEVDLQSTASDHQPVWIQLA